MFPYTFVNLVLAWTFVFIFFTDSTSGQSIDLFFILLFLFLAKYYYAKKPKDRSSAIAWNVAIFPLFLMNIFALPTYWKGESMVEKELIYIYPIIYLPMIYISVRLLLSIIFIFSKSK